MTRRAACLVLVALTLAACAPAIQHPTPTLIILGMDIPTTTSVLTGIPQPTHKPTVFYTVTPTIEPPPTHTPSATPTPSPTPRIFGTPSPAPATCQGAPSGSSLLVNGGFEGGQHQQDANTVLVPDGWTAYWQPIGSPITYDLDNHDGYQRPDMMVVSKQPPYTNPPRILEGVHALQMAGNQRAFDAGIYQVIAVPVGASLCLTGSSLAWSNRFSDDPFASTLDTADDAHNANTQLGIDPQGGTDPHSVSTQWGSVTNQYNIYKPMNVVQITATGPSVTVFVHGFMLWRFDHNELYFDDIVLTVMSAQTQTPTPGGSTPTSGAATPTPEETTQPPS